MEKIGDRVKQRREELGISKSKLAKKIGITQKMLNDIESGKLEDHMKHVMYDDLINAVWNELNGDEKAFVYLIIKNVVLKNKAFDINNIGDLIEEWINDVVAT